MPTPGIDSPGVGAGLVIMREDGKILLYRRLRPPEAGFWNIVGGKVEHMEPSAEASRREAEEETGLKIGKVQFLCVAEKIIAADRQHWISMIYLTRDFSGDPLLSEPDKLSDFGWFDPKDPPMPLSAFSLEALDQLAR